MLFRYPHHLLCTCNRAVLSRHRALVGLFHGYVLCMSVLLVPFVFGVYIFANFVILLRVLPWRLVGDHFHPRQCPKNVTEDRTFTIRPFQQTTEHQQWSNKNSFCKGNTFRQSYELCIMLYKITILLILKPLICFFPLFFLLWRHLIVWRQITSFLPPLIPQ